MNRRRPRGLRPGPSPSFASPASALAALPLPVWLAGWRLPLLLAGAAVLPHLGTLAAGFVLDDLPLIVENARVHGLAAVPGIWTHGYWPDRLGLTLYRPLTQSLWAVVWFLGNGSPVWFHGLCLALSASAAVLAHALLRELSVPPRPALIAALLWALLPIHTEAIASVVGSAELLGAVLSLAALLAWRRGHLGSAVVLYAAAVLSKESAAATAGLAGVLEGLVPSARSPRGPRRWVGAGLAAAVVVAALAARAAVAAGPDAIPLVDNPLSAVSAGPRALTALWLQVRYLQLSLVPLTLSADYSYKQIPLVMGLGDPRAWAGLCLLAVAAAAAAAWRPARLPLVLWAAPFAASANLLFPIGTTLAERLAFMPTLGLTLAAGQLLGGITGRHAVAVLALVGAAFAGRAAVRDQDWRDADRFYRRLVQTSPDSAKSHYFLGTLLAGRGDDAGAVAAYERAIAIFPAYSEAFHNRGNALARLGRRDDAMASYEQCLRFDPGHQGAAYNLSVLRAGLPLSPERRRL